MVGVSRESDCVSTRQCNGGEALTSKVRQGAKYFESYTKVLQDIMAAEDCASSRASWAQLPPYVQFLSYIPMAQK